MGRNEYGISGHVHIFAFLKHLMVLHFYTLSKTLIACRDMQLRLLNNVFKILIFFSFFVTASKNISLVGKFLSTIY